jgi:hypothetical protein
MKNIEKEGACSIYGEEEVCKQGFLEKPGGKTYM